MCKSKKVSDSKLQKNTKKRKGNFGITYGSSGEGIGGWTDSDFMGDARDTRSTTDMLVTLYGGAISRQSRLQPTIVRSTREVEYMAVRDRDVQLRQSHYYVNVYTSCMVTDRSL